MARFDGVPPNMSVRITTPAPVSARLRCGAMISLRRMSMSSSGSDATALNILEMADNVLRGGR
jgi:hypothetical protein